MEFLILIVSVLVGSLLSLAGGVLLLSRRLQVDSMLLYAMPFGAGALLGAAFFDILPEALEEFTHAPTQLLTVVLCGFVFFFVMERGVRWFHRHHEHAGEVSHKTLIVLGDTIHNAIDGIAIAAAFLVSVPLGIVTTAAVAAHEIPQEIGDFGLLLAKRMKPKKVLLVNVISSLATLVAALITYWLGANILPAVPYLLALVAGCFIYIAAADIIPDIHERPLRQANIQSLFLLLGVIAIPLVGLLVDQMIH